MNERVKIKKTILDQIKDISEAAHVLDGPFYPVVGPADETIDVDHEEVTALLIEAPKQNSPEL